MPYVRPHAYTTGTPIAASAVRANHQQLRGWINRLILPADIADHSVDWTHLLAGEFASVTPDHRFTTGHHYSRFADSEFAHWALVGLSQKTVGNAVALYHPIAGETVCVQVESGIALVRCWLRIQPELDDVTDGTGIADEAFIFLDGEAVDFTFMPFYAAELDPPITSDASGNGTSRLRECACHTLLTGLSAGYHTIELRVNPRHDLSLILSRGLYVELLEV